MKSEIQEQNKKILSLSIEKIEKQNQRIAEVKSFIKYKCKGHYINEVNYNNDYNAGWDNALGEILKILEE
jgi:hypothetical protein